MFFNIINLLVFALALVIFVGAVWSRPDLPAQKDTSIAQIGVLLSLALVFGWSTAVGFFYSIHRLLTFIFSFFG